MSLLIHRLSSPCTLQPSCIRPSAFGHRICAPKYLCRPQGCLEPCSHSPLLKAQSGRTA
ncbi:hypothetical protein BD309DRAFT_961187 [Dichomitus squalens]|nr:hypothetical protein BD309DRAFT_961187 [Dichomitus squalens]